MKLLRLFLALFAAAVALPAVAEEFRLGPLVIERPYARVSAARNGAAYVTIVNNDSRPDRLTAVASPRASKVEMHTMTMDGDIMRMREVKDIEVPANGKVEMTPGAGLHIMLIGLRGPLTAGERFPLSLDFERSGKLDVTVEVRKLAPAKQP